MLKLIPTGSYSSLHLVISHWNRPCFLCMAISQNEFGKIKYFHVCMNCLGWQKLLRLSFGGQILSDIHEITQTQQ